MAHCQHRIDTIESTTYTRTPWHQRLHLRSRHLTVTIGPWSQFLSKRCTYGAMVFRAIVELWCLMIYQSMIVLLAMSILLTASTGTCKPRLRTRRFPRSLGHTFSAWVCFARIYDQSILLLFILPSSFHFLRLPCSQNLLSLRHHVREHHIRYCHNN